MEKPRIMLTLNTPYKDNKFGTLYGNWDESSFMLEFEELILKKQDSDTYTGYGLLISSQWVKNKQKEADPNQKEFFIKFTLHNKEWTYKQKKDEKWIEQTIKPTVFEQLFIFEIEHNPNFYLNDGGALTGIINVSGLNVLRDLWDHYQRVGIPEYPPHLRDFFKSYPVLNLTQCPLKNLMSFLGEIEASKTSGNNNGYKPRYEVNRIQKFKELFHESFDFEGSNFNMAEIMAILETTLEKDKLRYGVFMDIASKVIR